VFVPCSRPEGTFVLGTQRSLLVALLLALAVAGCDQDDGPTEPDPVDDPETTLEGDPDDPAGAAIPDRTYTPRREDYSTDHPDLPGVLLSHRVVAVVFDARTTVDEANDLLRSFDAEIVGGIGGTSDAPGVLMLRVSSADHDDLAADLAALRDDDRVAVAVQDAGLGADRITDTAGSATGWTWETQVPQGGNWGLELCRVPQLWNLMEAVEKERWRAGDRSYDFVPTGVIDIGFAAGHEDLSLVSWSGAMGENHHGTHVAGIVGADFDDGVGIDGVNPFSHLLAARPGFETTTVEDSVVVSFGGILDVLRSMAAASDGPDAERPRPWVVNMSLGFGWASNQIDPDRSAAAQSLVRAKAEVLRAAWQALGATGLRLPLVVVSAGNDSDAGFGVQDARFNSPMTHAATVLEVPGIVVVEAVARDGAAPGQATRAGFSNVGGHVSAPGQSVLGPVLDGYGSLSGTSMAAPFVAGVAGFLLAIEPALTNDELETLLVENAVAVGGAARPRVDAYAAALAIDHLPGRSDERVLRMLLDVDDGSLDGNLRVNPDGTSNTQTDLDGDLGVGDGSIDMADFRCFRDALLQVENDPALALDGAPDHDKKDLNHDRRVGGPNDENVHPRFDFNGDGVVDRNGTVELPGFATPVTDLEVLQSQFDDPDHDAADLPNLLDSYDLEVDAGACLGVPGSADARLTVRSGSGGAVVREAIHDASRARRVHTLPVDPSGVTITLEARGFSGEVLASAETQLSPDLGDDVRWVPSVCGAVGSIVGEVVRIDGSGVSGVDVIATSGALEVTTITDTAGSFGFEDLPVIGESQDYTVRVEGLPPDVACPVMEQDVTLPRDEVVRADFECEERELPTGPFAVRVEWPGVDDLGQYLQGPPFWGLGYNVVLRNVDTGQEFQMHSDSAQRVATDPPAHVFQFDDVPVGTYEVDVPLREGCSTTPAVPIEVEHEDGPVISTTVAVSKTCS
jgi:subtilisin family serine protease